MDYCKEDIDRLKASVEHFVGREIKLPFCLMAKLPPTQQVKTVDRMGWRFVLLKDIYGNTFPQCFAPLTGELEIPEQA